MSIYFAGGLLLEDLVEQELERVRKVGQAGAAAGDLPGVEAQIPLDQLPEDVV